MKVWVLSRGSYSDRSVYGVCSSLEAAEKVMKTIQPNASENDWGGWNDPEEYELDHLYTKAQLGHKLFFIRMKPHTGDLLEAHEEDGLYGHDYNDDHGTDIRGNWCWHLWAESLDHAVKICGERRTAQLVAHGR